MVSGRVVDKRFEISNLELPKDIVKISELGKHNKKLVAQERLMEASSFLFLTVYRP